MLIRILLGVSIFTTGLLFAQNTNQPKSDNETISRVQSNDNKPKTASEMAVIQKLAVVEKEIITKVADLEKLQTEAIELNPKLQKEMRLVTQRDTEPQPGHTKYLVARYVEYSFESGNKIKEIRVVSSHRSLSDNLNTFSKVVSFNPGNLDSIKVTIDKLDTKTVGVPDVADYKDFAPEVKLIALKTLDSTLQNSIYGLDVFIYRSKIKKNEKNKNQLSGIIN